MATGGEITALLSASQGGDVNAQNQLFQRIDAQLKKVARAKMAGERAGHSWAPSDLMQLATLELLGQKADFASSKLLFGIAGTIMERRLKDHARGKLALKHGAGARRVELEDHLARTDAEPKSSLDLDAIMARLEQMDPRQARIVEMFVFLEMRQEEIAAELGVTRETVNRDWRAARAWLSAEIGKEIGRE